MNDQEKPVTELDLHAYLDGELDETDRLRIEAYMAEHPHASEQLRKYQQTNLDLHRLYDPVLNEPVSDAFRVPADRKTSLRFMPPVLRAAALAGIAVITGLGGWTLRGVWETTVAAPELVHLVQPAAFAHVVYSTDPDYPVEFGAEKQELLAGWLSQRMHTDIQAPELGELGFELVGGRLLPSTNRMAAQFMYQNPVGDRITVYLRREDWEGRPTVFQFAEHDGVRVFYWIDDTMGYAVSGAVDKERLITVARAVHDSFASDG